MKPPPRPAPENAPGPPPGRNRLARALSPYLLQHADNPVEWYPWGAEAFARAREEDKPVFLSAGYSTCHWCHVMERECFAREDVAAVLNAHFVSVKLDREERPDVDEIYMHATQLITGSGGWPNSVWLTPDRKPWYAGTYFPREDHPRGPGFLTVLRALAALWSGRRAKVEEYAARLWEALRDALAAPTAGGGDLGALLAAALREGAAAFDALNGGFGAAPKFPPHATLRLLAEECRRRRDPGLLAMLTSTLDAMAAGGIRDHVGGGFHRYAVDAAWRLPHFEKMLYDNAQLARAYTDGWLLTGDARYRLVALETCEWALREMAAPEGAFHSALDADSEGEEGRSYLWRADQIDALLGPEDGAFFRGVFPLAEEGNFEEHGAPPGGGLNVLYRRAARPGPEADEEREAAERRIAACLLRLRAARAERVGPRRDDKIIAAWNGLMLGSLAHAGRHLGAPHLIAAAERAAAFVLTRMRAGGRLLHVFMGGCAHIDAFLDDHACLAGGLLDLYEATGRRARLDEASAWYERYRVPFWVSETSNLGLPVDQGSEWLAALTASLDTLAARGLPVAEYSYVLHDRDTSDYGLQNLHTHIFIAGTFENEAGERESRRVDRQQVCADRGGPEREDNLHHVARREFEVLLDRTLGPAWRIERERQLELEAEKEMNLDHDPSPTVRTTPDLEIDL